MRRSSGKSAWTQAAFRRALSRMSVSSSSPTAAPSVSLMRSRTSTTSTSDLRGKSAARSAGANSGLRAVVPTCAREQPRTSPWPTPPNRIPRPLQGRGAPETARPAPAAASATCESCGSLKSRLSVGHDATQARHEVGERRGGTGRKLSKHVTRGGPGTGHALHNTPYRPSQSPPRVALSMGMASWTELRKSLGLNGLSVGTR